MQYYPFDSRNPLYRSKFGAVASGETLKLRLLLHNDAHVSCAYFCYRHDDEQSHTQIKMSPAEMLDDYRFYDCEISFSEGIYWYMFRYESYYGEFFVTKSDHNLGIVSSDGKEWQQTVYESSFSTPDWLDGGIIYQIFPDRFYFSGEKKENLPDDRFYTDNWEKTPEHRQNVGLCSLCGDYYCGDLKGIELKLPYLKSLGVTCIYLNPIFEAHSNHRYNTADYFKIDPLLGTEQDLISLIKAAENQGIFIILDGVFSHTGDDSIYFNRYGRYPSTGAYNSQSSPYYSWFSFRNFPDDYAAWWGVKTLPETNENDPAFTEFITGENGVLRYWLKLGIRGWRLDVADELPDEFLDKIRLAIKAESSENYLLGEVWEDATNKISYGTRRRFLRGRQLDSTMNYPFAAEIVRYVKGGNSRHLIDAVLDLLENYPPESIKLLMNHIGTHDTARILTTLGSDSSFVGDREWQSHQSLNEGQFAHGIRLLRIAAALQYTLPGIPSLYYGDEAGLTGYGDPFCRGTYPWGKENKELLEFYKKLGKMRSENKAFASGKFIPVYANFGDIIYIRKNAGNACLIAVNRWHEDSTHELPQEFENARAVFGLPPVGRSLVIPAFDFVILKIDSEI